ncbi:peptidase U32 family protein [Tenuifilum thalassicum]|uniref:U32 family peptidase n=1 Tax=Tenuifilum thalassicum TaxID=2590900 RepID=A0A7D3Y310_9BACT|nr:U32 family peptidase [Tenuifilum thalassicum]QKG79089.1 U32 family peptidase [Tenuifilum thalassicum]
MIELELLAPAKNLESGIAAITHGADAVYIAASKFGAREKAGNPIEDIEQLCSFAHQYHAKVYVTVNTIIYDQEIDEVQNLIHSIYKAGADAIIIQDFSILKMDIPPIALHASTQMHNLTPEHINFLSTCGISRVVLPRELSVAEIKNIRNKTQVELEFFVHGALCVSYSGQCYMSQALFNRSANRGACAQPCRLSYDLIDEHGNTLLKNKHLLSLKDLNLSRHIDELVNSGVTSFKIEGRLKDIGYVKNITAYYSNLLNQFIDSNKDYKRSSSGRCTYSFTPDPEKSFNRGFTNHFINGRILNQASFNTPKSIGKKIGKVKGVGKNFITISSTENLNNGDGLCFFNPQNELVGFRVNKVDENKIYPNRMVDGLHSGLIIYRNEDFEFEQLLNRESSSRKISCELKVHFSPTKIAFLIVDEDGITLKKELSNSFEEAHNQNILSQIESQLKKTGNTIFEIKSISFNASYLPFIPIKEINRLRRELLDELLKKRLLYHKREIRNIQNINPKLPYENLTYKSNVSNRLSRTFFKELGVNRIQPAFEIQEPDDNVELMVTRYCIKYELNLCPIKQNARPTGKLYLKNKYGIFPLVFDCKSCSMKVMKPKN